MEYSSDCIWLQISLTKIWRNINTQQSKVTYSIKPPAVIHLRWSGCCQPEKILLGSAAADARREKFEIRPTVVRCYMDPLSTDRRLWSIHIIWWSSIILQISVISSYSNQLGRRSLLRHRATSRKVADSIPDGVTGIFHWHNPAGRTMALGSNSVSNRNEYQEYFLGDNGGRCVELTALPPLCLVLTPGSLSLLEPSGPVQACNGIALPYLTLPYLISTTTLFSLCVLTYKNLHFSDLSLKYIHTFHLWLKSKINKGYVAL